VPAAGVDDRSQAASHPDKATITSSPTR